MNGDIEKYQCSQSTKLAKVYTIFTENIIIIRLPTRAKNGISLVKLLEKYCGDTVKILIP